MMLPFVIITISFIAPEIIVEAVPETQLKKIAHHHHNRHHHHRDNSSNHHHNREQNQHKQHSEQQLPIIPPPPTQTVATGTSTSTSSSSTTKNLFVNQRDSKSGEESDDSVELDHLPLDRTLHHDQQRQHQQAPSHIVSSSKSSSLVPVVTQSEEERIRRKKAFFGDARLSKSTVISSVSFLTGVVDIMAAKEFSNGMRIRRINKMTGNMIKCFESIAGGAQQESSSSSSVKKEAIFFGSMVVSYMIGIMLHKFLVLFNEEADGDNDSSGVGGVVSSSSSSKINKKLIVPISIVSWFGVVDIIRHVLPSQVSYYKYISLLTIGFGLINGACKGLLDGTICYAMTGNITRLANSLMEYILLSLRIRRKSASNKENHHNQRQQQKQQQALSIRKQKAMSTIQSSTRIISSFGLGIMVSSTILQNSNNIHGLFNKYILGGGSIDKLFLVQQVLSFLHPLPKISSFTIIATLHAILLCLL